MPISLIIKAVKKVKQALREEGDDEDMHLSELVIRKIGRLVEPYMPKNDDESKAEGETAQTEETPASSEVVA